MPISEAILRSAQLLARATALLVTAGAGMSADSGIRTFRDTGGLWTIQAPMETPGMTPNSFDQDPAAAWGFYALQRDQYRKSEPHCGYAILHRWASRMRDGYFVYTSNIDGQFQRAGFDTERIVECHGNLSRVQCQGRCSEELFPFPETLVVDLSSRRALEPLPGCPRCGGLARPNVLMFYDFSWIGIGMNRMHDAMDAWLSSLPADSNLVVFEVGAGVAVPSVRVCGEAAATRYSAPLIRVNPNEGDLDGSSGVSLKLTGKEAILAIDDIISRL